MFLFLLIHVVSFAQHGKKVVLDFAGQFPVVSLPDTIRYAPHEFDYGYYIPDEQEEYGDDANAHNTDTEDLQIKNDLLFDCQNSVLQKSDSLRIPYELVQDFLLTDSLKNIRYPSDESIDPADASYYFVNRIAASKKNYCLLYEIQHAFSNEKYLCTLSKTGMLIDKIKVASANYSGTSVQGDGFRILWFPDEKSTIFKNLTIYYFTDGIQYETDTGTNKIQAVPDRIYKIDGKGNIQAIAPQ
ncbi:hypothetical protein [Cytophaga hutchinsonii]|uniref:Uncharacterized protein n=1 Tax=Cytophaga hutchinsonii (strain ATCC 33406 / DSM 1761 / CIP 103989 / NBRC 15051 / NCIMB 9469 / D465) TaxID=269798 RepID=A0A6N4SQ66_CYTH3|nr:hypothetical protein [Cytophaga hutchinsonii]ABG58397.1 hypothetical protein CHU_1122 [Cytophaga hutchinsonii ATCC 33406]SFX50986.1 hypothetical protein SAMN04487930_10534 [Cytophaga hutchinsonii ATCC 33406]